jgi:hypothetical protein
MRETGLLCLIEDGCPTHQFGHDKMMALQLETNSDEMY